jgi:Holliday junction resolvase RusA-like endonuclease
MRKSAPYRQYEKDVSLLLPKLGKLDGKLKLKLEFGFSNKNSDIDNPVKPFQDIMQKKYGFNDSQIYALSVTKTIVKKGEEFIKFEILKN